MKPKNILSLFNGIGVLQLALKNLGVSVNNYYSSEIDKKANELQNYHFPNTIQLGDVNNWHDWNIDWSTIDFIGSGSPCQDISVLGNRSGLSGNRSSLFFVFVDILKHVQKVNPNVKFLQENVIPSDKRDLGIMSRTLGVRPILINSNLVTAQNRRRYYWSNIKTKKIGLYNEVITDIPQPINRNILIKDIIDYDNTDMNLYRDNQQTRLIYKKNGKHFVNNNTSDKKIPLFCTLDLSHTKENRKRILTDKTPALLTMSQLYTIDKQGIRLLNIKEMTKLQGLPNEYMVNCSHNKAGNLLGNSWTLPIIEHILNNWN